MSDLLRELRTRVDEIVRPHREIYGDDCVAVKMALRVLAEAEDIERSMGAQRVSTERAHELTGWARETLQLYARKKLAGQPVPAAWQGLIVIDNPSGYLFELGTIPPNPRSRAA